MDAEIRFKRPIFDNAIVEWRRILQERGHSTDLMWLFAENLVFEKHATGPAGMKVSFQTQFSPVPQEGAEVAYDYFIDFDLPLVFYRAGSSGGKSVCLLLCDKWFDAKSAADGFITRNEWRMSFFPGPPEELEEVSDKARWQNRMIRGRALHPLDFSMDLRSVHEILAHGRVLSSYEHYALKFLGAWRRFIP